MNFFGPNECYNFKTSELEKKVKVMEGHQNENNECKIVMCQIVRSDFVQLSFFSEFLKSRLYCFLLNLHNFLKKNLHSQLHEFSSPFFPNMFVQCVLCRFVLHR